jgi:hypothetical protein
MCHFMFLSFRDGPRWALMGLVVKLAQSVSFSLCVGLDFLVSDTSSLSLAYVSTFPEGLE